MSVRRLLVLLRGLMPATSQQPRSRPEASSALLRRLQAMGTGKVRIDQGDDP